MRLRAQNAGPSVGLLFSNQPVVRAMTYRMYRAMIPCLSAAALMLAANQAFARSGAAHGGRFVSTHSVSHPPGTQAFRHHRRTNAGGVWLGDGAFFDGQASGEPVLDAAPPTSGDVHYTYTQDVPWDWAHRYPPAVARSERPYVSSCPTENVTVPGRDGREQTISVTRCY